MSASVAIDGRNATEEGAQFLVPLAMIAIEVEQAIESVGQAMDWHLRDDLPEVRRAFIRTTATHEHEVLRHCARTELADASLESDGRDVMLAAAVRAPADL